MPNLSQLKRKRMLEFLDKIKEEHKNDDEMLIALGEIENELNSKKYGLVWEEHEEKVDVQMRTHIPVFTEVKRWEISAAPDKPYNFLLEGDNLHSLYLLEKTHKGSIDLIYIDPPYNTGNEDFIYDDKFVNEEDSFRHSKWLSFMAERLQIASRLLSEQGVIFIQISDIELAQLKCLCDDIFGEDNFLNIISVNMKNIAGASGGGEDKRFKKNCEYILVYAKSYSLLPLFNGSYVYTEMSSAIEQYRAEGKSWHYNAVLLDEGEKKFKGSTVDGDGGEIKIYERKGCVIKSIRQLMLEDGLTVKEVFNKYGNKVFEAKDAQSSIRTRVIDARNRLDITEDVISIEYIPKTGKSRGKVYEQFYKGEKCRLFAWLRDISEMIGGELYKKTLQGTYWDYTSKINNLTKEGNMEFSNGKKPLDLLKQVISLYPKKDITILDFFAGSGTTGHAVIALNQEDGGSRKFVLCTNNENNICSQKTYPRLYNAINGYNKYAPIPANLKYYRTDFVSRDEEFLSDALLEHIAEMIQLEHGVKIDGSQYLMVMSDTEADELQKHFDKYNGVKALYVSKNVLLTTEQLKTFDGIEIHIIPDNYFKFELKEEGQAW